MEFFIGTLIGLAALVVSYLAYRSQARQTFKRIHYSSFATSLIVPTTEDLAVAVKCQGEDLIYPLLCAARFENTGLSPILPSDFDAPISIRLRGSSVFRTGILSSNRPGVIDFDRHPDVLGFDLKKKEVTIGPMLLNPRDSVTLVFIADAIPDKFDVEVVGRIAGIEDMIRLPKPIEGIMATVNVRRSPAEVESSADPDTRPVASVDVFILPVIADPEGIFDGMLEVLISGTVVRSPHLVTVTVENEGSESISFGGDDIFTVQLVDSRFVRLLLAQVERRDSSSVRVPHDAIKPTSHSISVCALTLDPGEFLRVQFIVSGACSDLVVVPHGNQLRTRILNFVADGMVENNLSETEPRIFLTNQRAYLLGRSLLKEIPWLSRVMRHESSWGAARPKAGPDIGESLPR
jgi:hypothetical protein